MKLLAVLAIGLIALVGASTASAQEVCKISNHPRSPDCPTYPTELPVVEASVKMLYPVCIVRQNASAFPKNLNGGQLSYWGGDARSPINSVIYGEDRLQVHSKQRSGQGDYGPSTQGFNSLLRLLESIESGHLVRLAWLADTQYGRFQHADYADNGGYKWHQVRANITAHELKTRVDDCIQRLEHEKYNRLDRKLALEDLTEKLVALEQSEWALSEELRLQKDLLALTQAAIAAQKKTDEAWRAVAEARIAGIKAQAALWDAYAADAAADVSDFYEGMLAAQDQLDAAIAKTEANLAKRDAVRQDIEALIGDYEAKLADLDAKVAAAQAEAAQVNAQIDALRNAN